MGPKTDFGCSCILTALKIRNLLAECVIITFNSITIQPVSAKTGGGDDGDDDGSGGG